MSAKHKVVAGFGADAAATVSAAKTMILGSTQTEELRSAVEKALAARGSQQSAGGRPPPLKGPASCDMATTVMDARALGLSVLEQARVKPRFDPGATTIVDSLDSLTPSAAATALLALPVAAEAQTERWKVPHVQRPRLGVVAAAVGVVALALGYASFAKPVRQQSAAAHVVRPAAAHAGLSRGTASASPAPLGAAVAAQPAAAAALLPTAATAAQPAAATAVQPVAAVTAQVGIVTPAAAAHAFALGDDGRALASYRELARQFPQERSYSVMVDILTARQRSDSRD